MTLLKMKIIVFGMALFLLASFPPKDGFAQPVTTEDLLGITFPNSQTGWACGRFGVVLQTVDGGRKWVRQNSGTDYTLTSIFFTDAKNGWAVGDEGIIIHTSDGGKTWIKQKSPVPFYLMGVFFVDSSKGWIVTERTHILHTEDGGKTWAIQFKDQDYILSAIAFADPLNGWAVGEFGYIYRTTDGGKNWKKQAGFSRISENTGDLEGGNYLFAITAINSQTAWAVGIDGYVIKTTDGGRTWKEISTGAPRTQLFGLATNKKEIIAIGGKGTFLVSLDGGNTWKIPKFEPPITYDWLYGVAWRGGADFMSVGWQGSIYYSGSQNLATVWKRVDRK